VTDENRNKWTLLIFDKPFTVAQILRVNYTFLNTVGKCAVHLLSSELSAAPYVRRRLREFTVQHELKSYTSFLKVLLIDYPTNGH
jgi:hypothetical protein